MACASSLKRKNTECCCIVTVLAIQSVIHPQLKITSKRGTIVMPSVNDCLVVSIRLSDEPKQRMVRDVSRSSIACVNCAWLIVPRAVVNVTVSKE